VRWPRGTVTTLSELKTDREVVVRESRR
jgi:hypothetical protein